MGKRFNKGDRAGWKFVGSGSRRGTENVAGNLAQPPLSTPENLDGDLYGSGFLSVDLPCLVDYLGGGGCELVAFRHAPACACELVETAGLAFHCAGILAPSGWKSFVQRRAIKAAPFFFERAGGVDTRTVQTVARATPTWRRPVATVFKRVSRFSRLLEELSPPASSSHVDLPHRPSRVPPRACVESVQELAAPFVHQMLLCRRSAFQDQV